MRKTIHYTVEAEGRDKGKVFVLTEMPALKAEEWAIRAILALGASNVDLPDGAFEMGMEGLAAVGLKKLFSLRPEIVKPLLDDLMLCVEIQPDRKRPEVKRALIEQDVEEVKTLLGLKWEVLKLHVDFSIAESLSSSISARLPAEKQPRHTRTSRESSASS